MESHLSDQIPSNPTVAPRKLTPSAIRINQLAAACDATTYLEIGVQTGATFRDVNIPNKVAVDPVFRFDVGASAQPGSEFHEITSDDYFSKLHLQQKFDIIFLDGLHTFEQTFRDFCNSLHHCHERTIWVMDDTVPSDIYSAHKVQTEAVGRRVHELKNPKRRAWHGDVYKVMFAIYDFFPSISFCTLNTGPHKQSLLWPEKRKCTPLFNDLERISRLDYFDFLKFFKTLEPLPESEALERAVAHLRK
jgi:hypothetical protein